MVLLAFLALGAVLPAQDFSRISVQKVATGYRFTEGPVWSHEGFLLFSDVPNNRILKYTPGAGATVFREESNGANGNTIDPQGRLLTCESRSRRVTRTGKDGKVEVLADRFEGKRLNAPNDIVVRKDGNIYFTDPAFGQQADSRELDFYGVYHLSPERGRQKPVLTLIAKPQGRPNGVTLSPNGRILYVANSDERSIRAYDLDSQGAASNERLFISNIDGPPDGIRVDEKGNLYVTCRALAVYNAQGKLLHTIEFPETPRNCAFGDPDLQTLYVTAMTSLYRVRLDVKGSVQY